MEHPDILTMVWFLVPVSEVTGLTLLAPAVFSSLRCSCILPKQPRFGLNF